MDDIISLGSESDSSLNSSAETSTDIFYIYRPASAGSLSQEPFPVYTSRPWLSKDKIDNVADGKKLRRRRSSSRPASEYVKHSNLDTKALSLSEEVHLRRVHYLTFSNAIRLLLIVLCFVWFLFNAYTVFNDYLRHESTVFMEFRSPKYTLPPAITICTDSILVNYREELKVSDVFDNVKFTQIFMQDSDNVQCYLTYSTISDADEYRETNCSDLVPVLVSIQEGRMCRTFFSDVYGEMSKLNRSANGTYQFDFESFPSIRLIVIGGPIEEKHELYWHDQRRKASSYDTMKEMSTTGLSMALHDPTQIHYMHDLPMHSIPPGKYLDSRFSKKIEEFNPNTGCVRYNKYSHKAPDYSILAPPADPSEFPNFKETNLAEYRSRGECFSYCIARLLNNKKCINVHSILTKDIVERDHFYQSLEDSSARNAHPDSPLHVRQVFCINRNDSFIHYLTIKAICMYNCRSACLTETYDVDTNLVIDYRPNVTVIDIQWSPEPITFISHREKFDNSEFVGNLGGLMHIYLGISVIHLVRYVISLVRNGHFVGRRNRSFCQRWLSAICHRH